MSGARHDLALLQTSAGMFCMSYCLARYMWSAEPDLLNRKVSGLTVWKMSHVGFHAFSTALFPGEWAFSLAMGVAWEIIELVSGEVFPPRQYANGTKKVMIYAEWSDLVANTIGVAIGLMVANIATLLTWQFGFQATELAIY